MRHTGFSIAVALTCLAIQGCASTPQPVLDLAGQGVAVTSQAESEVDAFVSQSNRLYSQRYASVKRLALGDIDATAKTDFENYTAQRAGMTAQAGLMKLINDLADYRAKTREDAQKKSADVEKTLGVSSGAASIPKEKMAELRKAFAALSQELSDKEWLKFSIDFGKQVNASVKASKADAVKAEKKSSP